MKSIVYETLHSKDPERIPKDIIKILKETNTELVLRCAKRGAYISDIEFNEIKDTISVIKKDIPDILFIGNLYAQFINLEETDDITKDKYNKDDTYNLMSLDPVNFGINSVTKYDYQHQSYGWQKRWTPDITLPKFQKFFINQAQRLINAGVDGIWIDGLLYQSNWINKNGGNTQKYIDGIIYVSNEIKKLRTIRGKIPLLSTWIPKRYATLYLKNKKVSIFDFLTTSVNNTEVDKLTPGIGRRRSTDAIDPEMYSLDWDETKERTKYYYNNVPIYLYLDWGIGKTPLWYFTQSRPKKDIKNFEVSFLNIFTEYLKKKGIDFSYPVHGGLICSPLSKISPCNVGLAHEKYDRFDSLAPEFDIYSEIVRLMKMI